jgi:hypothetical protein
MSSDPQIVSDSALSDLQDALAAVDLWSRKSAQSGRMQLVLLKRQHVKIRMRREQNHSLPHFHIEYKKESSASYPIEPFQRLAGDLSYEYEDRVSDWIVVNQKNLLATWEALQKGDVRELVQAKDA